MKQHDAFIPWAPDRVLCGGLPTPMTTMQYRQMWTRLMIDMKAAAFMELKLNVEVAECTSAAIRRMMDRTSNVMTGKETED